MEELGQEIENIQLLPIIENVFVYNNKPGHEVIFAFTANFKDKSLYERETIEAFERTNEHHFTLFWQDPTKCPPGTCIFPTGLEDLLK